MANLPDTSGQRAPRRRFSTVGSLLVAATLTLTVGSPATARSTSTDPVAPPHVDNPYADAQGYRNPQWRARAEAEPGGQRISDNPTAVWLDQIAAIDGAEGRMGVRAHLDEALAQQADYIQFVLYNLPGRDCPFLLTDAELGTDELDRYRTGYIDPLAAILADPKYASLRIITIVEVRALPSIIVNTSPRPSATFRCDTMRANGNYILGIRHALNRLQPLTNVYPYLDVANHAWVGWDDSLESVAQLIAYTVRDTTAGLAGVDGFITNTADYAALREPHVTVDAETRPSRWIDWNRFTDELSFAQAFRQKMISLGFPTGIGMLIDTSRNGWGGPDRPIAPSTDPDLNIRVDASRVDRRAHKGNWCNQAGAGIGERPRANPEPGIDAYVWAKPPGESDGSPMPSFVRGFNPMCSADYQGNVFNDYNWTTVLPGGPDRGEWFPAHFRQLLANAYPPLT